MKWAALGHFGNRFVEKPSVLSQIAEVVSKPLVGEQVFQELTSTYILLPRGLVI